MKHLNLKLLSGFMLFSLLTVASAEIYSQSKFFIGSDDEFNFKSDEEIYSIWPPEGIECNITEDNKTAECQSSNLDDGIYSFVIHTGPGGSPQYNSVTVMVGFNPEDYYTKSQVYNQSKIDDKLSDLRNDLEKELEDLEEKVDDEFAKSDDLESVKDDLEEDIANIKEKYIEEDVCGNWICEKGEDWFNCSEDCPKPECPECPSPSKWSECENKIKNRTVYICNQTTNFTCQEFEEIKECSTMFGPSAVLINTFTSLKGIIGVVLILFGIGVYIWRDKFMKLLESRKSPF